jgi:hypothetical protein
MVGPSASEKFERGPCGDSDDGVDLTVKGTKEFSTPPDYGIFISVTSIVGGVLTESKFPT